MNSRPATVSEIQASLPDVAKDYIAKTWGQQGIKLSFDFAPYYSRVRVAPDTIAVDGSNNTTYTFNQGKSVLPFQYGQGGSMLGAGFAASLSPFAAALPSDTNLQAATGRVTNDNALVVIQGIGLMLSPMSDPLMAQYLWPELVLTSGFGSTTQTFKHGLPAFCPGAGTLFGGGTTQGQMPNAYDTNAILPAYPSNGFPGDADYHMMNDQIVWYPTSGQTAESNFGMQLTLSRAVSYIAPARALSGLSPAIVPPATVGAKGTFVDIWVRLFAVSVKPRTTNN